MIRVLLPLLLGVPLVAAPTGDEVMAIEAGDDLAAAVASAPAGAVVELGPGRHRPEALDREAPGTIVVRAAAGADAVVEGVEVRGAGIVLDGLHLAGRVHLHRGADGAVLRDATVEGTVVVEADGAVVEGSTVRPAPDDDAVVVTSRDATGPADVVLRGNVLGPSPLSSPTSDAHVDCLQVSSAVDLLVEGNALHGCAAQTVLVKSDLGPIDGVVLRENALRGCVPVDDRCGAVNVLQVVAGPPPMPGIQLDGNVVAGRLRVDAAVDGVRLADNVAARVVEGCHAELRGNVVGQAPCPLPPGNLAVDGPAVEQLASALVAAREAALRAGS